MHISKATWLRIARLLVPIILPKVVKGPAGKLLTPIVAAGIEEAEGIEGATGSVKLEHVKNLIDLGIAGANATGKVNISPEKAKAATDTVSLVVNLANAIEAQSTALEGIHVGGNQ